MVIWSCFASREKEIFYSGGRTYCALAKKFTTIICAYYMEHLHLQIVHFYMVNVVPVQRSRVITAQRPFVYRLQFSMEVYFSSSGHLFRSVVITATYPGGGS